MTRAEDRSYDDLSEALPVDVIPASNGEFIPPPPTAEHRRIMQLANEQTEVARRALGMDRRTFVRTAGAYAIGIWAISQVSGGRWGSYALSEEPTPNACDLQNPKAQLANLPGEFIFDVQSHHVDPQGQWRVTNPGFHAFMAGVWEQSGPLGGMPRQRPDGSIRGFGLGGELDPVENLSRTHYVKELFLDSSTNCTVLSAVPSEPDNQPLPLEEAHDTVTAVNRMARSRRSVMHAFVMPNRGSAGTSSTSLGQPPAFMAEEFELMERNVKTYGPDLRGWKVYTPWGDVPNGTGWFLDDDIGLAFLDQVMRLGTKYGAPRLIAAHKGFALPAFDQRAASPRDVGPAARQFPGVTFLIYHSGFDGDRQGAYPGDDKVNSADRGVDCFIKSLRENGIAASQRIPAGLAHGNTPNVYGEIGATWHSVMSTPDEASHLLGKLITHVGPKRICWGTDSLWYGTPQPEIVALRAFRMTDAAKKLYNLPYGIDGDVDDPRRNAHSAGSYMSRHRHVKGWPTDKRAHPERSIRNAIFGRNAARAYRIDADAHLNAIKCDEVEKLRESYLINPGTERERAPYRSNTVYGYRDGASLLKDRASRPWAP